MQTDTETPAPTHAPVHDGGDYAAGRPSPTATPGQYHVIRRNGKVTSFDGSKIQVAITKAFLAVEGGSGAASSRVHEIAEDLTNRIMEAITRRLPGGGTVHIEDIQDQVELALMRDGHHKVARSYVLYREERAREREAERAASGETEEPETEIRVQKADGSLVPLETGRIQKLLAEASEGLEGVDPEVLFKDTRRNLFDGVTETDLGRAMILSARQLIEREPDHSYAAARLLLDQLRREALGFLNIQAPDTQGEMGGVYPEYFEAFIDKGIELDLLDEKLKEFDLQALGNALKPERDLKFTYLGLQTLYDRYFLHTEQTRYELPQAFFMRVAMGLALNEIDREARAIEFYELLSSFDFMSSTPTLFNSGTIRSQLSSCYLTTVGDDLDHIYGAVKDNALLSKFAGGLGNDWTRVRAMGSYIKGTNGQSQGVVPFLKVANDTAVAVNQCFAPDTLVHTAEGPRAIKSIRRGDLVLGVSGTYREVTDKMLYNQEDPMVSLTIKHSIDPVTVTAGHPFYALRGVPMEQANARTERWLAKGKVTPEWVDAGELKKGDYVAQVIPGEVVPVPEFTEDDARLYGILLGDGHLSKDGNQWGVSGNPEQDTHMQFVREYLAARGIHYWETARGDRYAQVPNVQINWAAGRGALRDATTGRITGAGEPTLPFTADDLYDADHNKRIAPRLAHLPRNQTLALVQGLLETDGSVSRGKEIYFTSTSRALAEGLRYQLLRLKVPTAGQYRERTSTHSGRRSDGSAVDFSGTVKAYDIRVPAVPEIAERIGCRALTKRNWIEHQGCLFSRVKSVESTDVAPFVFDLKVEGDASYMTTAGLAHNGGKRKGAVCAYLETWHLDIEEFLDLRKNTGDERRRTHDMNTANWIPDLFMQRVHEEGDWTLFSPNEVPELHDLYGQAFTEKYLEYEAKAERGDIRTYRKVSAVQLWRKMLTMLFETGHPWMTFKDPCNLRSPQQHTGVVHSSNLCTEITLNTSDREIAVCNLGSVNLANHVTEDGIDGKKLQKTIGTAMRMLDNVIDINYYSVEKARRSNLRHRPVGLGIMGFQDALYKRKLPYASEGAVEFADESMELVSYYAIQASTELAEERGRYATFEGSLWSQGILPIDSLDKLAEHRPADYLDVDRTIRLDWESLRERVKTVGMRNSNTMAIAPTATISNICGVSQSIEPTFQNLFVKSNLSGEFTVINGYLVDELKARDLWDEVMVNDLKYYDGNLGPINRIPEDLKQLFATAFEVDPKWLVDAAARRQKWIDQAQSLNLYMAEPSGPKLDKLYRHAWQRGLKTTYYLRSAGATQVEKSTMDASRANRLNAVDPNAPSNGGGNGQACAIDDPECEACQ